MRASYLGRVPYDVATALQEQFFFGKKFAKTADLIPEDTLLFLEHPPVYTYGRSVDDPKVYIRNYDQFKKRIEEGEIELRKTSRGGLMTFHGPGQLVGYPIVNIESISPREYTTLLAEVLTQTLSDYGIQTTIHDGGLWVERGDFEHKIASFGVKMGRAASGGRITMHGFALNVTTDLSYFEAIDPCGIQDASPMITMSDCVDATPTLQELATRITEQFAEVFQRSIRLVDPQELGYYPKRKPDWLPGVKILSLDSLKILSMIREPRLTTVCEEARCPNIEECWNAGDVTIMTHGDVCTRNCGFCAVKTGKPGPLNPLEPYQVSQSVRQMQHSHIVITSVDRDDLADGGSRHWAQIIRLTRREAPDKTIEVLVGDFKGVEGDIQRVLSEAPHVFGHNIETVERLHPHVRPQADYERSLNVLRQAYAQLSGPIVKSNIMLGHGESEAEVVQTLQHLRDAGVDVVTITQYLQPTRNHLPVIRYYSPEDFSALKKRALSIGFSVVISEPRARTSYRAGEAYQQAREARLRKEGMSI